MAPATARSTAASWRPERHGPAPLYDRIKSHVIELIENGPWKVSQRIPSEHELVRTLGASRMTVNRALRELAQAGYLHRSQGVGTFVAQTPTMQVVVLRPGDRVVSRMPTEEERVRLGTGYLTPVLVVTRSDGYEEQYNAAVTVCQSQRLAPG